MAKACRDLLEQKCKQRRWQILELAIQPDHIHLFVRVWPPISAAQVVKECKGSTAFSLRRAFRTGMPDGTRLAFIGEQAQGTSPCHRLDAVGDPQFLENMGHMAFDGRQGDHQPIGNLQVGVAAS
jgi:REP element-mobilizing transposase RayT